MSSLYCTVYEYDEVYDKTEDERKKSVAARERYLIIS